MDRNHVAGPMTPWHNFIFDQSGRIVGWQDPTGARDFYPVLRDQVGVPAGLHYYVDLRTVAQGHKGNNSNDGRSWDTPVRTMAQALGMARDFDTIHFIGRCTESGFTSSYSYVTIVGGGQHPMVNACWKPSGPALTLSHKGWVFANFKAEAASESPFLRAVQSAAGNGSDGVLAGVEANGGQYLFEGVAVDNWTIVDVFAHDMQTVIRCADVLHSPALRWQIAKCRFVNNDNHVVAKLTDSEVYGNRFQAQGNSKTATVKLDLRGGGGRNLVHENFVGGTFSEAGGYFAHANDEWGKNWNNGGVRDGRPA